MFRKENSNWRRISQKKFLENLCLERISQKKNICFKKTSLENTFLKKTSVKNKCFEKSSLVNAFLKSVEILSNSNHVGNWKSNSNKMYKCHKKEVFVVTDIFDGKVQRFFFYRWFCRWKTQKVFSVDGFVDGKLKSLFLCRQVCRWENAKGNSQRMVTSMGITKVFFPVRWKKDGKVQKRLNGFAAKNLCLCEKFVCDRKSFCKKSTLQEIEIFARNFDFWKKSLDFWKKLISKKRFLEFHWACVLKV